MQRNASFEEISDGVRYRSSDMVKADCGGCQDCSACCRQMGDTVELDPLDVHRMSSFLHVTLEQLLKQGVELRVSEGVILPGLAMKGEAGACSFLSEEGRCRIHPARPGICRLFPLGRLYEDGGFSYFLQVHECPHKGRTKVKVKHWIDMPDLKEYEAYGNSWHYFLKEVQRKLAGEPEAVREVSLYLLHLFFQTPYDSSENFYIEFYRRLDAAKQVLLSR